MFFRYLLIFAVIGSLALARAQTENPPPAPSPTGIPGLSEVPGLKMAHSGSWGPLVEDYTMNTTSAGPSPADLLNRGFYQLQLFRSPQAARHFLAALREDPHCAMAWVGLYFALLERGDEVKTQREQCYQQAIQRRDKVTPHEQTWIEAMSELHLKGVREFAIVLDNIRRDYPGDLHATLWLPLMLRDGYDAGGQARPGQRAAEALLRQQLQLRPDDPVVLHAWCQLGLASPKAEDFVGQARLLLELQPPSPYFRQAAGLILFRRGEISLAVEAFESARSMEEQSLKHEGIAPIAAPTYFDNLDCLAMALTEAGRIKDALALAEQAMQIELPWSAPAAPAVREFGFFTLTAATRIHARSGNWDAAAKALPKNAHALVAASHPVALWLDFLRNYCAGQIAIAKNKQDDAKKALNTVESLQAAMNTQTAVLRKEGFDPQWTEVVRLADFLQYELRAAVKYTQNDQPSASHWWRTASERQLPGLARGVPRWSRPAVESMAQAYLDKNDALLGVAAWEEAVRERLQSGWALRGLLAARTMAGDKTGAANAAKALEAVWPFADEDLKKPQ